MHVIGRIHYHGHCAGTLASHRFEMDVVISYFHIRSWKFLGDLISVYVVRQALQHYSSVFIKIIHHSRQLYAFEDWMWVAHITNKIARSQIRKNKWPLTIRWSPDTRHMTSAWCVVSSHRSVSNWFGRWLRAPRPCPWRALTRTRSYFRKFPHQVWHSDWQYSTPWTGQRTDHTESRMAIPSASRPPCRIFWLKGKFGVGKKVILEKEQMLCDYPKEIKRERFHLHSFVVSGALSGRREFSPRASLSKCTFYSSK